MKKERTRGEVGGMRGRRGRKGGWECGGGRKKGKTGSGK